MEKLGCGDAAGANVIRGVSPFDGMEAMGRYRMECVGADGGVKWVEEFDNLVTTEGKKALLDIAIDATGGSTAYLGLISSVSYTTGPQATDVAAQINGTNAWKEAGNGTNYPNWSTPASNARGTCAWSASDATAKKALSSAISFVIATNGGTVKGCFIVFGTGAVATNANTSGKLLSAGTFASDKVVSVGDTLNVSYSVQLT